MSAPETRAQATDGPHPAHIHSGTCDELGDIVQPLTDVEENTAGEVFGAKDAERVEESETDVPMTLSDILASPHAVNIHESAENIQNYIACGNIGGRVVDGELLIGLMEINGSGHHGIAKLDSDNDSTQVTVYLAEKAGEAGAEEAQAAPAATDTPAPAATTAPVATTAPAATTAPEEATAEPTAEEPAAPAAAEVPVDIRDFAFSPNPVEVPVGGTVTWTNQDAVPHTATSDQRGVLQSGAIAPGSSFSQVFDTAGEFAYHCEFHPNMTGTIIVK
jgi:plastocyanin